MSFKIFQRRIEMTLTDQVVKKIIIKLLKGQDYRIEIVTLLDADFLQYVIDFFQKVVTAKLNNRNISLDWYKAQLLDPSLPKDEIAINSGLNIKTISNMFNTARREVVLDASGKHYDSLFQTINSLVESNDEINVTLTIKFKKVSVDLNLNESLIVINSLAVKRAAMRGGYWSTAGKCVEKPLMLTLCSLFNVPREHYSQIDLPGSLREVDFYLFGKTHNDRFKCEVKLMGKGNPESADAVIARGSRVFVADKLSELNKKQLTSLNVEWVELRAESGYKRFEKVLENLGIPFSRFDNDLDDRLNDVLEEMFPGND